MKINPGVVVPNGAIRSSLYIYMNKTYKLIMVALAAAAGLLAAGGLFLGMARSAAVTTAAIAAAPLLGGWLIFTAPPKKRVPHLLGLAAFGLIVGLAGYVLPLSQVSRIMLGYLAWYALVEAAGWLKQAVRHNSKTPAC